MPLILEGMRRFDELQQAEALVPEDIGLIHSGVKPSRPERETDREFLRDLWRLVTGGATAGECETRLAVDSYRVRCAIAHWCEEGALQPAQ
jgi:hypothetical protein